MTHPPKDSVATPRIVHKKGIELVLPKDALGVVGPRARFVLKIDPNAKSADNLAADGVVA